MGFKCGIVGLPNVGKSTLFNALTKAGIESANYPFCTIEPNIGVVTINDIRLEKLAKIVNPKKILSTTVEFVDIAGLVAGASKGEGLGNQFLTNIRETDAIIHVVRCFENADIIHVAGKIDPIADADIVNTELMLADLTQVENLYKKAVKNTKSGQKDGLPLKEILEKLQNELAAGQSIRSLNLTSDEKALIKPLQFLSAKPVLYVANVSEDGFKNNPHLDNLTTYVIKNNAKIVVICADIEVEIAEFDDDEKQDFLSEMGQEQSGLDRLIQAGYDLLGLQTYFTAGAQEVRAWTISQGDTAPQAAGKIHGDFEKGFIRAETIAYADFIKFNGEKGAKENGKMRVEGKEYIMVDGDVVHFLFNV